MRHYTNTDNPVDFPVKPETMRARCEALVIALVGREMSDKWWNGSNKPFCGDTPEQIYSVAPSAVYAYLMKSVMKSVMKSAEGEW